MRKILLSLILGLVMASGVYALMGSLFPDNAEFPRVPNTSGTIGYILERILGATNLASYV
jgi:hypothetical protein